MSEYNEYVTAVNKIFDYLSKMKAGWNSMDNKNYIDSIEEYKEAVINNANKFNKSNNNPPKQVVESLEALGND